MQRGGGGVESERSGHASRGRQGSGPGARGGVEASRAPVLTGCGTIDLSCARFAAHLRPGETPRATMRSGRTRRCSNLHLICT